MHESSLKFLRCPRCGSGLDLAVIKQTADVDEGFLECDRCDLRLPIVDKIPIMWDDFARYLSEAQSWRTAASNGKPSGHE